MKILKLFFIFLLLFSCNKENENLNAVARVNDQFLTSEEFKQFLPKDYSPEDSIALRSSIINGWATNQLLLEKAKFNVDDNQTEIETLVEKYRRELLIDKYKEALLNQLLDTVVTAEDIDSFYVQNKDIYRLNEALVRIKFIHFNSNLKDNKELVKLFRSDSKDDESDLINRRLEFNSFNLNDSIWVSFGSVLKRLPFLAEGEAPKKISFLQKEDSLGVYLVAVKDVLNINDPAPKSYAEPTIKKMILHRRKLELSKEIEKSLLSDAVKNKKFEIY